MGDKTFAQQQILDSAIRKNQEIDFQDHLDDGDYSDYYDDSDYNDES